MLTDRMITTGSAGRWQLDPVVALICVFALWGPAAMAAIASPAHWIHKQSPGVGKPDNVCADARMVRYENGTVLLTFASTAALAGTAALLWLHDHWHWRDPNTVAIVGTAVLVGLAFLVLIRTWWRGKLRDTLGSFVRMLRVSSGDYGQ
jgi:hypothetical protein